MPFLCRGSIGGRPSQMSMLGRMVSRLQVTQETAPYPPYTAHVTGARGCYR